MISQKIQDAFNGQINAELFSSYLYLSMSSWFGSQNLDGMATWMRLQAQEEVVHAMKFYDFILERGGRVVLAQLEAPKTEWDSPAEAFEDAYDHECKISAMINDLVDLVTNERDHAANVFLHWFVTEQVEEEDSTLTILEKMRIIGDNAVAQLMLDKELGQRMPSATEQ